MDLKTLREIQRKERMSPYLQDLGKDFYRELEGYVWSAQARYLEESKKGEISRLSIALNELKNIKDIVSDIYETREKKIVHNALYYVKSEDSMGQENLTEEEMGMLRQIMGVLRERRDFILGKVMGEYQLIDADRKPNEKGMARGPELVRQVGSPGNNREVAGAIPREMRPGPSIGKITVRMLKDLPSIVGADGKVYGAFKQEDVITLPEPNARVLIGQGAAEAVEVKA